MIRPKSYICLKNDTFIKAGFITIMVIKNKKMSKFKIKNMVINITIIQ